MQETPVFEQRPPQEVVTGSDPEWLARTAAAARESLNEQVAQTANDEVLTSIYQTTTDPDSGEVAKGWADGPYTEEQIHEIIGDKLRVAARRFGVTQKKQCGKSTTSANSSSIIAPPPSTRSQ